ncbi:ROK family protein [Clostridium polynesiense]|uniref:ROK family protein n=1 Tax=Clostridium polynesiense TaxID=1325933 RepID=UPI00058EAC6B|nr:ROK family protein [Clostridium polynesiense]
MKNIACFDVGGTFIKYAVINSQGDILTKNKFPSPVNDCKNAVPECIIIKTKELMKDYLLQGIGISTAGVVDNIKGEIITATDNLPGYAGAKLSEVIYKELGIKTFVENDVNAAALGEMWKGAAVNKDTFVCMTLGTGVGGAIVINNKLYKGVNNGAGELGHMILNEKGQSCNCGCIGCYERYASTSAFIRMYLENSHNEGIEIPTITGEEIMLRVKSGETLACRIYDEFMDHIANGLASIAHILDPGLIVIGGGISAQGEDFFLELNKRFKSSAMASYAENTMIVPAKLQNDAGLLGACYITLKALKIYEDIPLPV